MERAMEQAERALERSGRALQELKIREFI